RENDAWLADVPKLAGAHTWAKNLPKLDEAVREVIAMVEDLPEGAESTLELEYEYGTGDAALDALTQKLRADREQATRMESELAKLTLEAVERLSEAGMSVRDMGALLDLSPQRISQISPKMPVPAVAKERRSARTHRVNA
ncbi:MAG: hypothetical protein H0T78_06040, partial [Longispora sp.]|nr:hypothetical protein [Longispora sp. (in: high G+C Gram-positive bacteria)]